jgi:RsiW-degrading membrane proteinase PrsW (M82 family)
MSIPLIFNAFTVADIISIATDTSLPENSLLVKIILAILYFSMLFCLYQYFGTKKRIKVIFDEFEHISKNKKIVLGILSFIIGIAYAVGSIMVSLHFTDIIKCRDLGICS